MPALSVLQNLHHQRILVGHILEDGEDTEQEKEVQEEKGGRR